MLLDKIILKPSTSKAVIRVLEQEKDGSILYSCHSPEPQWEEIRLFCMPTQEDILIYVNSSGCEIVNASLNPDRNVIAFTTLKRKTGVPPMEDGRHLSADLPAPKGDDLPTGQSGLNWLFVFDEKESLKTGSEKSQIASQIGQSCQPVKGSYISYLADIYPTSWIQKFDVNRGFYQRVVFTNCNISKGNSGLQVTENRLLLIMHKKTIGVYSIVLRPQQKIQKRLRHGQEKPSASFSKMEIHTSPLSSPVVRKAFWSQWDPSQQRLYYIVITKKRHRSGDQSHVSYSQSLFCEQFTESHFHQQVFSCCIDLGITEETITKKSSAYYLLDMNPTVSSPDINIRLLALENGSLCIAWQTFSSSAEDNALYKVMVLDKGIEVHCLEKNAGSSSSEEAAPAEHLSFSTYGDNVLVCGPSSMTHILAVDCLSGEKDAFYQHCHYLSKDSDLRNVRLFSQLPFQVPTCTKEHEEANEPCIVFDHLTGAICMVHLEKKRFGELFFESGKSLENKIAMARFGCIGFRESSEGSSLFKDVLSSFLSNDMILNGDQLIGNLLIHMAANDVRRQCPAGTSSYLCSLLPIAVHMPPEESRNFMLSVYSTGIIRGDIHSQIIDADNGGQHAWENTINAFACGHYAPYDLHAINEELLLLKRDFVQAHLQEQKATLKNRLNERFENEILRPVGQIAFDGEEENILNCFCAQEQDHFRENVMTLTYEKLLDHLKRYFSNDSFICQYLARNFVTSQLGVVNHMIALFILVAEVEDHDRKLIYPVQKEERNLLQFLNIMLLSCVSVNFPVPSGFQTFLTCLTFRCCLTTHITNEEEMHLYLEDSDSETSSEVDFPFSYVKEDIEEFSFEFLQLVDCKCIQLTGEFVARLLEELPNHDVFEKFIYQVLLRANLQSSENSEGLLQLWKHPEAKTLLAKIQMKNLMKKSNEMRRHSEDIGISHSLEQSSGFGPLDTFLDFVCQRGDKCKVEVESVHDATMQSVIRKHGKENLKHIAY